VFLNGSISLSLSLPYPFKSASLPISTGMSRSPESAAVFDASGSETNVEDNQATAGEEHYKDNNAFQKRLTLSFKNVTVNVTAPGEALGDTLLSWVNPSQLLNPFRKGERTQRVRAYPGH
jgi:hypothetical protein